MTIQDARENLHAHDGKFAIKSPAQEAAIALPCIADSPMRLDLRGARDVDLHLTNYMALPPLRRQLSEAPWSNPSRSTTANGRPTSATAKWRSTGDSDWSTQSDSTTATAQNQLPARVRDGRGSPVLGVRGQHSPITRSAGNSGECRRRSTLPSTRNGHSRCRALACVLGLAAFRRRPLDGWRRRMSARTHPGCPGCSGRSPACPPGAHAPGQLPGLHDASPPGAGR